MPTDKETRASAGLSSINTRLAARDFGAREKKLKAAENTNIKRADTPMGAIGGSAKKGIATRALRSDGQTDFRPAPAKIGMTTAYREGRPTGPIQTFDPKMTAKKMRQDRRSSIQPQTAIAGSENTTITMTDINDREIHRIISQNQKTQSDQNHLRKLQTSGEAAKPSAPIRAPGAKPATRIKPRKGAETAARLNPKPKTNGQPQSQDRKTTTTSIRTIGRQSLNIDHGPHDDEASRRPQRQPHRSPLRIRRDQRSRHNTTTLNCTSGCNSRDKQAYPHMSLHNSMDCWRHATACPDSRSQGDDKEGAQKRNISLDARGRNEVETQCLINVRVILVNTAS